MHARSLQRVVRLALLCGVWYLLLVKQFCKKKGIERCGGERDGRLASWPAGARDDIFQQYIHACQMTAAVVAAV